jgi:hypothetical protein
MACHSVVTGATIIKETQQLQISTSSTSTILIQIFKKLDRLVELLSIFSFLCYPAPFYFPPPLNVVASLTIHCLLLIYST